MTNRRLIAMIQGRATAGDPVDLASLAARPPVVSALSRCIGAVGVAGVLVALGSSVGGGFVTSFAQAQVTSGVVSGQAASTPVPGAVQGIDGSRGSTRSTLPGRHAPALLKGIVAPLAAGLQPAPPAPTPTTTPAPPAPAKAVAPTPTVVPQPPVATPAPGSVEAIIIEVFGAHGHEAIGVARCESHLNPGSVSRNGANWGLFQINTAHRARVAKMGYRWEDLLDPRVNALVARSIYAEQGWRPWACRGAAR